MNMMVEVGMQIRKKDKKLNSPADESFCKQIKC